ncbi:MULTISPECIES: co-chaperone YbbN [unclassified Amycolatopsis]|uniref:thioredoxin family protein n=1 Tax=unclassified Amycolatopsis TaxID=2618356 RepID=UPI001C699C00|nr:thioredoxin family protein [Amycolatopsis sp. DSM 110486]QYN20207.1 thioredoxin family protein [Amycolatopsis sp. DSM 110486]
MDITIEKLDTAGFDAAVAGSQPALVVFTAPWCTVCRGIDPDVRQLAEANPWGMVVRRVVIDDDPALAQRFDIRSIPSALLFTEGELAAKIQPRKPGELQAALEEALAGGQTT